MTKKQADKEARLINNFFNPFCPLIMNECRHDCICFHGAKVEKEPINKYEVEPPYCSNNLFVGEIGINRH